MEDKERQELIEEGKQILEQADSEDDYRKRVKLVLLMLEKKMTVTEISQMYDVAVITLQKYLQRVKEKGFEDLKTKPKRHKQYNNSPQELIKEGKKILEKLNGVGDPAYIRRIEAVIMVLEKEKTLKEIVDFSGTTQRAISYWVQKVNRNGFKSLKRKHKHQFEEKNLEKLTERSQELIKEGKKILEQRDAIKDATYIKKIEAVLMFLEKDMASKIISQIIGVTPTTIESWVKKADEEGFEALKRKKRYIHSPQELIKEGKKILEQEDANYDDTYIKKVKFVLLILEEQMTLKKLSEKSKIPQATINGWVKKADEEGFEALKRKKRYIHSPQELIKEGKKILEQEDANYDDTYIKKVKAVIVMLENQKSITEISIIQKVSTTTLENWVKKADEEGFEALRPKRKMSKTIDNTVLNNLKQEGIKIIKQADAITKSEYIKKIELFLLILEKKATIKEVSKVLGVSDATIRIWLNKVCESGFETLRPREYMEVKKIEDLIKKGDSILEQGDAINDPAYINRIKTVLLVLKGKKTFEEISQMFGITSRTIYRWVKRFEEGGFENLKTKPTHK